MAFVDLLGNIIIGGVTPSQEPELRRSFDIHRKCSTRKANCLGPEFESVSDTTALPGTLSPNRFEYVGPDTIHSQSPESWRTSRVKNVMHTAQIRLTIARAIQAPFILPNAERSHAGPLVSGETRGALPALAPVNGWAIFESSQEYRPSPCPALVVSLTVVNLQSRRTGAIDASSLE